MSQKAFIIGGTGMLEAATRGIAPQVKSLTLIARSPQDLAGDLGARALPMDWTNHPSIDHALAVLKTSVPYDLMVSWIHRDGMHCLTKFESLLAQGGRSIRVHGSAAGDPSKGISSDPHAPHGVVRQNVVLGWINQGGSRRWLNNAEISQGVMRAFRTPAQSSFIVGELT